MAEDLDLWGELNGSINTEFNLSQSVGIPRFEDSQTDHLFNLGLSMSQEIPMGSGIDYDETGMICTLQRYGSLSLFPGLPRLPERPVTTIATKTPETHSLLSTSTELSDHDYPTATTTATTTTTTTITNAPEAQNSLKRKGDVIESSPPPKKIKVEPPEPRPPVFATPTRLHSAPPPPTTRINYMKAEPPPVIFTPPTFDHVDLQGPGSKLASITAAQARLLGYSELRLEEVRPLLLRAAQLVEQISQLYDHQSQSVAKVTREQLLELEVRDTFFKSGGNDASFHMASKARCQHLMDEQEKILKQVSSELQRLGEIMKTLVLDCCTLYLVRTLILKLQLQAQQLGILREEILRDTARETLSFTPSPQPCLVILEQPLPHVLFKGKLLDVSFTVGLLTGARTLDPNVPREVTCVLEIPDALLEERPPQLMDNCKMILDASKQATFNQLKINVSTRMMMVSLKFAMDSFNGQATPSSAPKTTARGTRRTSRGRKAQEEEEELVEPVPGRNQQILQQVISPASYPVIVITHENQWVDAASKLLLADCFSGCQEVSWPQFANTLHSHFLSSIKQDLSLPTRALQLYELSYFHTKWLGKSETTTVTQAQSFFAWFGHVQRTIRFKKHISHLWNEGLIFAFMLKETCDAILSTEEPGVFILRFSDSRPGLFAVAYVSSTQSELDPKKYTVKHYMVNNQDTGSNKSLPDFLRGLEMLTHILKLDPVTFSTTKMPKDTAFQKFYTKQKLGAPLKGYVNNIHTSM